MNLAYAFEVRLFATTGMHDLPVSKLYVVVKPWLFLVCSFDVFTSVT